MCFSLIEKDSKNKTILLFQNLWENHVCIALSRDKVLLQTSFVPSSIINNFGKAEKRI